MENPSAFPMGEPNDGFAQYFVGQSYLAPVLETPQIAIHNVTFEPGCRNTTGTSITTRRRYSSRSAVAATTRSRDRSQRSSRPGRPSASPRIRSTGMAPPPGESCSHLAFMVPAGDPASMSNEWLEPVDAEAYGKLA